MVHGGPKSIRFSGPKRVAVVGVCVVFLFASGAKGPADVVSPSNRSLRASKAIPKKTASIQVIAARPPQVIVRKIATPSAEILAEIELLHDMPLSPMNAVPISADALVQSKVPRVLLMEVTAYCACKKCCGSRAQGLTASGRKITYNGGHFVAADLKVFPFGTKLIVPGYADGKPVEVIDRGGAIRGNHIDIFMPTHQNAVEWGKRRLQVTVLDEK